MSNDQHSRARRIGTLIGAVALLAATGAHAADIAKGKEKAEQVCAACHGKDGNTPNAADVAMLGGQYADYLAHALMAYRDGLRDHPLMGPQAKDLTDQQIADAAAYFSRQPAKIGDLSHM